MIVHFDNHLGHVRRSRSFTVMGWKSVLFSALDARYDVTYFWLIFEFVVLKRSVRPLVRDD